VFNTKRYIEEMQTDFQPQGLLGVEESLKLTCHSRELKEQKGKRKSKKEGKTRTFCTLYQKVKRYSEHLQEK
jgi:hypothetical protein